MTITTKVPENVQQIFNDGGLVTATNIPVLSAPVFNTKMGATVAVIGDSFLARSDSNTATATQKMSTGVVHWGAAFLGQRFSQTMNVASSGVYTSDMVSTQISQVLNASTLPNFVYIMGGINDIYNYPTSALHQDILSAQSIFNNLSSMANAALNAGCKVIMGTIPPTGASGGVNAYANWSSTKAAKHQSLNQLIRNFCQYRSDIILHDWYSVIVNATSLSGDAKGANYLEPGTGLHPTNVSCYVGGKELARVMSSYCLPFDSLPKSQSDSWCTNSLSSNFFDNPLLVINSTGTVGGANVSGTAAQGLTVSSVVGTPTVGATTFARGDGLGLQQGFTVTPGAANDTVQISTIDMSARLTAGDTHYAEAEITVSTVAQLRSVEMLWNVTIGGTALTNRYGIPLTAANERPFPETNGTSDVFQYRTPPLTLPSVGSITSAQLQLNARFFAATTTPTYLQIGRIQVRKM